MSAPWVRGRAVVAPQGKVERRRAVVAAIEEAGLALVVAAIEGPRELGRQRRLLGHGRPAEIEEGRVVHVWEDPDLRQLQAARAQRSLERVEPGLQGQDDPAQDQDEEAAESRGRGRGRSHGGSPPGWLDGGFGREGSREREARESRARRSCASTAREWGDASDPRGLSTTAPVRGRQDGLIVGRAVAQRRRDEPRRVVVARGRAPMVVAEAVFARTAREGKLARKAFGLALNASRQFSQQKWTRLPSCTVVELGSAASPS